MVSSCHERKVRWSPGPPSASRAGGVDTNMGMNPLPRRRSERSEAGGATDALLDLLQIADSSFPSGSYAHSLGLEMLYSLEAVDLEEHLRFLLKNGLARVELPVLRLAFHGEDPQALDLLMDVLMPVKEFRMASRSIGRSFLRAVSRIKPARADVEHHAVAFGVVLSDWKLDLSDGLHLYAFQAVRQQLSAAQRLGKIGQTEMQDLLHALKPAVRAAVEMSRLVQRDEIGGFSPWLDLAGMAHEHQHARLFLS
jgi:urease accessory protein